MNTELLTYDEAAAQLRVSKKTIQRLIAADALKRVSLSKSPRGNRITRQSITDYIAGLENAA